MKRWDSRGWHSVLSGYGKNELDGPDDVDGLRERFTEAIGHEIPLVVSGLSETPTRHRPPRHIADCGQGWSVPLRCQKGLPGFKLSGWEIQHAVPVRLGGCCHAGRDGCSHGRVLFPGASHPGFPAWA